MQSVTVKTVNLVKIFDILAEFYFHRTGEYLIYFPHGKYLFGYIVPVSKFYQLKTIVNLIFISSVITIILFFALSPPGNTLLTIAYGTSVFVASSFLFQLTAWIICEERVSPSTIGAGQKSAVLENLKTAFDSKYYKVSENISIAILVYIIAGDIINMGEYSFGDTIFFIFILIVFICRKLFLSNR